MARQSIEGSGSAGRVKPASATRVSVPAARSAMLTQAGQNKQGINPRMSTDPARAMYKGGAGAGVLAPSGSGRSAAPAPAPSPNVATGYSGGPVSALSTGVLAEGAPPPPPMSLDEFSQGGYAGQDAAFAAEDASAEAELRNMLDQLTRQNSEYQTGFKGGLRDLGWNSQGDDWKNGSWNPEDTLGAYGQSSTNLENDYSGRGMMDSTFYGQAQRDLTDRFNRQKGEMITGLDNQNAQFAAGKTAATESRNAARNRALAEAYARFTSGLAL